MSEDSQINYKDLQELYAKVAKGEPCSHPCAAVSVEESFSSFSGDNVYRMHCKTCGRIAYSNYAGAVAMGWITES